MTSQLDMFTRSLKPKYPNAPGYRNRDTSLAAAKAIEPEHTRLKRLSLAAIQVSPRTADEVASLLERTPFSIRPRVAELAKAGLIVDSGYRRRNESGKSAIVWRVA